MIGIKNIDGNNFNFLILKFLIEINYGSVKFVIKARSKDGGQDYGQGRKSRSVISTAQITDL
jgi:hypothetical protein